MNSRTRCAYSPGVAAVFLASFVLSFAALSLWYDIASAKRDPVVLFQWLAIPYLCAYSFAEVARRVTWTSGLLLLSAAMLLASDLARHGNLLLQQEQIDLWLRQAFGTHSISQLSLTHCAVAVPGTVLCAAFEALAFHQLKLIAAVGVMIVVHSGVNVLAAKARRRRSGNA